MLAVFNKYMGDFLFEMMPSLENYIFIGGIDLYTRGFHTQIYAICDRFLSITDENKDTECICCCRLLCILFQSAHSLPTPGKLPNDHHIIFVD
jgi:hypothetical protein